MNEELKRKVVVALLLLAVFCAVFGFFMSILGALLQIVGAK